jgi:5-methylcytosine-specific restriction endonuclease McrA
MCRTHWSSWYRKQFKERGKTHHPSHRRTCEVCGSEWFTPRIEARFCTAKCKGVYLSEKNKRSCKLDPSHPVMVLIEAARQVEREKREAVRREAQRVKFEWRTARECPGCACWFTPLYTPNTICCSQRCSRRIHRWRRNAAERGAVGTFTWSQFMAVARRFEYRCAYCGGRSGQLDPDHVVPLSRGGHNSTTNLLPSCRMCNGDKRDLLLDEWATDREARGKPARATHWAPEDRRYWHLTQVASAYITERVGA